MKKPKRPKMTSSLVVRCQNWAQYLLFGWFLAVSILLAIGGTLASQLALAGVGLVIVAIMASLVALGIEFFRAGRRNHGRACGVLLLILILTVVVRLAVVS